MKGLTLSEGDELLNGDRQGGETERDRIVRVAEQIKADAYLAGVAAAEQRITEAIPDGVLDHLPSSNRRGLIVCRCNGIEYEADQYSLHVATQITALARPTGEATPGLILWCEQHDRPLAEVGIPPHHAGCQRRAVPRTARPTCRWSESRERWETIIRPGVSKEACGHPHVAGVLSDDPEPGTLAYAQRVAEEHGDLDDAAVEAGDE